MINHNAEGASTETINLPLATDKGSIAIFIIHEKVQLNTAKLLMLAATLFRVFASMSN